MTFQVKIKKSSKNGLKERFSVVGYLLSVTELMTRDFNKRNFGLL